MKRYAPGVFGAKISVQFKEKQQAASKEPVAFLYSKITLA
jgi:hypothetical protein